MPSPVYEAKMLPGPRSLDKPVVTISHAVWDRGIEFRRVGEAEPESKCPSKLGQFLEARGVEPLSSKLSTQASTCVAGENI